MTNLSSQDLVAKYEKIRKPVDTVGFATKSNQMDEFMKTLNSMQGMDLQKSLTDAKIDNTTIWKAVISPHDDYTYVGYLYPALLSEVKAKTIILFGVCHVAKKFGVENKIIFDSFSHWSEPYGNVPVSKIRGQIIEKLPQDLFLINDSVQSAEHSVEAIIPFLQYYNRDIEIVSILVPYMPFDRMNEISEPLAKVIKEVTEKNNMKWGNDFSIIISTDAVHYGDKDWGDKNYAYFGADENGYKLAVEHEYEIINNCLTGNISKDKIKQFVNYTVSKEDYKDYIWTWCGRYSVPFGLLTVFNLENYFNQNLTGTLVKYATSLDHPHIPVKDISMGETAPANINHWVGYAAIGYK
jgi:AmmeMemoRadiSam system protein B